MDSSKIQSTNFFQALRLIQVESGKRLGRERNPTDEPLRIVVDPDASFPCSEVSSWSEFPDRKPSLAVSFFGLYGASGALPAHYTQTIQECTRQGDHALKDFLDIFNHRLLSMFYMVWEKYHSAIAFETATHHGDTDNLTNELFSLVGAGMPGSRNGSAKEDTTSLYYSGVLANRHASCESIRAILEELTQNPIDVIPMCGQWLILEPDQQSRMGEPDQGLSIGNRLGEDTLMGNKIWDVESRFRIQVGPISWNEFASYLPSSSQLLFLFRLVRRYVGPQFDFDLQVIVKGSDVRCSQLTDSFQLGWNSWIGDLPRGGDALDAVFELPGI